MLKLVSRDQNGMSILGIFLSFERDKFKNLRLHVVFLGREAALLNWNLREAGLGALQKS